MYIFDEINLFQAITVLFVNVTKKIFNLGHENVMS